MGVVLIDSTLAPRARSMLLAKETDANLLFRWQRDRDEDAFAALVDRYRGLVSGVCWRHSQTVQDAEDAFQAVFFLLARDGHAIRDARRLPGWLLTVAMRIAVKIRAESNVIPQDCDSMVGDSPSPLERLGETHQCRALDEEIAELPDRFRQPIVLHFLEGKSYEETAAQLETTVGSIRARLRTGTRRLRRRLVQRGVSLAGAVALVTAARTAEAAFLIEHSLLNHQLTDGALPRGIDPDTTFTSLATNGSLYGVATMKVSIGLAVVGVLTLGAALVPIVGHGEGERGSTVHVGPHASAATLVAMQADRTQRQQPAAADNVAPAPPPEWVGGSAAAYEKFEKSLEKFGTFEFLDEPLESVVQVLSEQFEIPIILDVRALEDIGISRDEPITIMLPSVRLESALNLMLPPKDLTYQVRNEVLILTSIDEAERNLLLRTYWIDPSEDVDELMMVIQSSIEPDNWDVVGGNSTIMPITLDGGKRTGLVVGTTYTTHRQIESLLDSFFPDRGKQVSSGVASTSANREPEPLQPARRRVPASPIADDPFGGNPVGPPAGTGAPDPFGAGPSADGPGATDPFGAAATDGTGAPDPFGPRTTADAKVSNPFDSRPQVQ